MTHTQWSPSATRHTLEQRAVILHAVREWFRSAEILEVETPQLMQAAITDPHIDSFATAASPRRYLRTSAEFHLKRMLSAGYGDVYEMGKVFRIDESGRYHNPEFTMLEWYRCGIDHLTLIDEVHDLLRSLHGDTCPSLDKVSYRELWLRVSGIDLAHADAADVAAFLESQGCEVPPSAAGNIDTVLDLGMATVIAASLPKDGYTCIYNYPASQASLARIDTDDRQWPVAHRFEFYFGSVELANGYHELNNAQEQRSRFEADNAERVRSGREAMPLDMRFVDSVDHLPDCAGVAIGMDRLLMILLPHISSLQQVLSFDWNQA